MTNQEALTLLLSLAAMVNLFIVTHIGDYFVGRLIGKVLVCVVGTDIELGNIDGRRRIVHMEGAELWSPMNKIKDAQHRRSMDGDL